MARLLEFDTGPDGPALLALDGTAEPGDHERFAVVASGLIEGPPRPIHLDFDGLGSINHDLAREVTRLRRAVDDRDGVLTFSGLNVVVRWVLMRCFGALSLDEADLPPGFSDHVPTREEEEALLQPLPPDPADTSRPVGPSIETIRSLLHGSDDPAEWAGPLDSMIRLSGLGSRVHLFFRDGDRLCLSTRSDHEFEADGWLGSLLAAAGRVLDVNEVGEDGLSLTERAALLWSGADLLVPAVSEGRLYGVVTVITGREGGYRSLRSGETLALTLFGELLGQRLAAVLPAMPAAPVEPIPAAAPVEAVETHEEEPVLV